MPGILTTYGSLKSFLSNVKDICSYLFFSLPAFSTGGQGCCRVYPIQVVGNAMSQTWSDRHRILLVTRARQRLKNWGVSAGAMAAIALAWTPGIPHDRFDRTTSHQAIKPSIAWFERFERRTQSIHKSITFDSVDSYIFLQVCTYFVNFPPELQRCLLAGNNRQDPVKDSWYCHCGWWWNLGVAWHSTTSCCNISPVTQCPICQGDMPPLFKKFDADGNGGLCLARLSHSNACKIKSSLLHSSVQFARYGVQIQKLTFTHITHITHIGDIGDIGDIRWGAPIARWAWHGRVRGDLAEFTNCRKACKAMARSKNNYEQLMAILIYFDVFWMFFMIFAPWYSRTL